MKSIVLLSLLSVFSVFSNDYIVSSGPLAPVTFATLASSFAPAIEGTDCYGSKSGWWYSRRCHYRSCII